MDGMCRYLSFYNCQTLAIVDQLICGGQVIEEDAETHEEHSYDRLVRELDQITVPKSFVDRTFQELFIGLLRDHGALAMGLYRTTVPNIDGLGFVFTNPGPTEVVEASDLVYVLH